jgi:hypothetical protein
MTTMTGRKTYVCRMQLLNRIFLGSEKLPHSNNPGAKFRIPYRNLFFSLIKVEDTGFALVRVAI